MSLLLQAMTSDNEIEISHCIKMVLSASPLGLIHESINVNRIHDYTRMSSSLSPLTISPFLFCVWLV
jgi:meiotically up-regulated gene 157 (Mug157) protein